MRTEVHASPLRLVDLPVYFSFLDGQIDYQCKGCQTSCCEHAGRIYVGRDQLDLVDALGAAHATPTGTSALTHVDIGFGGCAALLDDGHCSLHRDHGLLGKPALCALFPFSRLLWLDDFLVVAPTLTFTCPVQFGAAGKSPLSRHSDIRDLLQHFFGESALAAFREIEMPGPGHVTLEGEQRFVRLVNEKTTGAIEELIARFLGKKVNEINNIQKGAARHLGQHRTELDANLWGLLRPALPSLRTYLYELPEPALSLALAIMANWFADLASKSSRRLGLRQAASIVLNSRALLGVLAQMDLPVALSDEPQVRNVPNPQAALEAKVILRCIERHPGRDSLSSLLAQHSRLEGHARRLLLHAVARNPLRFGDQAT